MDKYTGEVTVGGGAQTRSLSDLDITKVAVGPMSNNAYLLRCRQTGEALMIDAANDADTLTHLLATHSANALNQVVTTHQHPDHWQALAAVVAATGASTAAGRLDAAKVPVATDTLLDDGDKLAVGACALTAIHLTGHTPGSIAIAYQDPTGGAHIFTGDSLFPGGPGKTGNPTDFTSLMDDLEAKIFGEYDDATRIYPGHGNDTTLGSERPHLPTWRTRGW